MFKRPNLCYAPFMIDSLFNTGYALGWCGVDERLLDAPEALWMSMWLIGTVICLYVILPALIRLIDAWIRAS